MFNVKRTYPAPSSLNSKKSYNEQDVKDELNKIFFGKCYLCECKPDRKFMQVEHLISKTNDASKIYEWDNLFYACSQCNRKKSNTFDNIIMCTDSKLNVLHLIKLLLPKIQNISKSIIVENNYEGIDLLLNEKIDTTCRLLNNIYNLDKVAFEDFREAIQERLIKLEKYKYNHITSDNQKLVIKKLQGLIKKEHQYSAFVRWAVLEDEYLKPLLEQYID